MAQCPDPILCRTGGHWQLLHFRYGNGESAAFYPTTNYTSVLPGRGRPAGGEQNQRHPHCAPPGVACNNTDCHAISRGDLPCNRTALGLAMPRPETGTIPPCRLIQPVNWQTVRPIASLEWLPKLISDQSRVQELPSPGKSHSLPSSDEGRGQGEGSRWTFEHRFHFGNLFWQLLQPGFSIGPPSAASWQR